MESQEKVTIRINKNILETLRRKAFFSRTTLQETVNHTLEAGLNNSQNKDLDHVFTVIGEIRKKSKKENTNSLIRESRSQMK